MSNLKSIITERRMGKISANEALQRFSHVKAPSARSLEQAMRDWRDKKIDDNQAFNIFLPRLEVLANWAARKYDVPEYAEDIKQELSLALMGKAKDEWHPWLSISSYMAGWAWRIASSMRQSKIREDSFDDLYSRTELETLTEAPAYFLEHIQDDHHIYVAADSDFLYRVTEGFSPQALENAFQDFHISDPPIKIQKKSSVNHQRQLTPNRKLLNIRNAIGLTRADMAVALGISLGRYAGYESGKIRSVPKEIYERADLALSNMRHRARLSDEIGDLEMSEIVNIWCILLDATHQELANFLDVSLRTLRRWSQNDYKPRPSILIRHHLRVRSFSSQKSSRLN